MKKTSQASQALAASLVASDLTPEFVAATAKAPKKAAVAKVEAEAPALTVRELAVLKAISVSEFIDPKTGAVPSYTLAIESAVPYGTVHGEAKVNSPIPGIVASLNKKGAVLTSKEKGQTLVVMSKLGKEFMEAAQ